MVSELALKLFIEIVQLEKDLLKAGVDEDEVDLLVLRHHIITNEYIEEKVGRVKAHEHITDLNRLMYQRAIGQLSI